MKTRRPHTHPCDRCGKRGNCEGELRRNHDGWPQVICDDFHNHFRGPFLCETCEEQPETTEATA